MSGRCVLQRLALALTLAATLGTAPAAAAGPAEHRLTADTTQVDLMTDGVRIEDAEGTMTPQQALAATAGPTATPVKGDLRARPDARGASWIRYEIESKAAVPERWLLEVTRPELRRVQAFVLPAGGRWMPTVEVGDSLPFSARPIPHRNFVLPLDVPPGAATLLLRVQTDMPARVTANLLRPATLEANDLAWFCLTWLVLGIIGAMAVYNLLLWTVVRDRGYLFYVALGVCSSVSYVTQSGLGAQYVWGDASWLNARVTGVSWAAATFFRVALTRHFLVTRVRLPWADRALLVCGALAFFVAAGSTFLPRGFGSQLLLLVAFGSSVLIDVVSVIGMVRRWPGASYYCASWLVLSTGILAGGARFLGLLPNNLFTNNIVSIAAAISYMLMSIALAHQISEEKRQKELAQSRSLAVLHASQAIASETRLDRLHARLREVMTTLTAATSVQFLLWDADAQAWFLYEDGGGRVAMDEAVARGLLSLAALHEVERTREPLLVADALGDERLRADPAFAGAQQCSLMALPVLQQGALRAVLLLENRRARGAFATADIDTLVSIAAPLAVSLENVLLYERLEQRVADQTRELRRTQQALVEAARRAGMAEIATGVLHNVGNILNSVNVAADQIRSRVRESRTAGLARAVDLLDANAHDLGRYLGEDPKGRLLPGYLRELAGTLAREREELLERAQALTSSVDHIKDIVATQQAHAGPATFAEAMRPADLVEDALRLADAAVPRANVDVVREVEDVPAVRLDKTRVLQILVNLVANARQAMEAADDAPRALRVRLEADAAKLRFRVQDEGCGIAPEDMPRIFTRGFSTRRGGHGFGLHSCAIAAGEMGGSLTAHSAGAGQGATFTLELPLRPA